MTNITAKGLLENLCEGAAPSELYLATLCVIGGLRGLKMLPWAPPELGAALLKMHKWEKVTVAARAEHQRLVKNGGVPLLDGTS